MAPLNFIENCFRYARTSFFGRRSVRLRNRSPLISFTFDDFPRSALYVGGEILKKYGATGTYYTALGLMNTDGPVGPIFSADDLSETLRRGHELGCHTFDHYDTWTTHPETYERSIIRNREELNRLLPGANFSTFSYPLSIPRPETKRRIQKHFQCGRSCFQTFNSGRADLNLVRAFFLEQCKGDVDQAKAVIDKNAQSCGWLVFATHDVSETPTRFGCTPAFFEEVVRHAVESRAKILPVAKALEEISVR